MEGYCQTALYFIIQITPPTMRIIFPNVFLISISNSPPPNSVLWVSIWVKNYLQSCFSETGFNTNGKPLNEKRQSSKVDKLSHNIHQVIVVIITVLELLKHLTLAPKKTRHLDAQAKSQQCCSDY